MENRFGKSYNTTGSSSGDYLIKTRGDVVAQCGNKYVKIVSGGKLVTDSIDIKETSDIDSENKKGLYYDKDNIYLKDGDNILTFSSNSGEGYLSFKVKQELKGEEILLAQKNLGLIRNINDGKLGLYLNVNNNSLYYNDEDGNHREISYDLPDIISKEITHRVLNGDFILKLIGNTDKHLIINDDLSINSRELLNSIENINNPLLIKLKQKDKLKIEDLFTYVYNILKVNNIESEDYEEGKQGYSIRLIDNKYTLEIDNIIKRDTNIYTYEEVIDLIKYNKLKPGENYVISDYFNEWDVEEIYELILKAETENTFSIECEYRNKPWKLKYDITPRYIKTEELDEDGDYIYELDTEYRGKIISLTDEFNNTLNYDFKNLKFYIDGVEYFTFDFNNNDNSLTGKVRNNNIYIDNVLIQSKYFDEDENKEMIEILNGEDYFISTTNNSNINISDYKGKVIYKHDINNMIANSFYNVEFNDNINYVNFKGLIEDILFDSQIYPLLYDINKSKDVYRNDKTYNIIFAPDLIFPSNVICMLFKGPIPDGWAVCNGENGTPDLIGSFIKADIVSGEVGGSDYITIKEENLPSKKQILKTLSIDNVNKVESVNDVENKIPSNIKPENVFITADELYDIDEQNIKDYVILYEQDAENIKITPKYYSMIFIMKL